MAESSTRYALPLLQSGQAQKEVTHNSAIAAIDALLHLAVETRTASAPPTAPANGAWIVGTAPTGNWAGHSGDLAIFDTSGWAFVTPRDGCLAFVRDEGVFAVRSGGAWRSDAWPVHALAVGGRTVLGATPAAIAPPAGGSVIDIEARAAVVELTAALRSMGLIAAM